MNDLLKTSPKPLTMNKLQIKDILFLDDEIYVTLKAYNDLLEDLQTTHATYRELLGENFERPERSRPQMKIIKFK